MERYRSRDGKIDAFPFNNEWNDTDGDGIGDNSDDDADGDGWTNEQENQTGNTTSWLDSGSSLIPTATGGWTAQNCCAVQTRMTQVKPQTTRQRWRLRPHGR